MTMPGDDIALDASPATATADVVSYGEGKKLVPVFANILGDVGVSLTVRLGSGTIPVRELLALRQGAVIALDLPLNGVVDVCLNDAVIARGEIVAVGDHYGVRVTEVAELDL